MLVFETGNFIIFAKDIGDAAEAIKNLLCASKEQRFGKRLASNLISALHRIDITQPCDFYLDNESTDISLLRTFRNTHFSADCSVFQGKNGVVVHTYPEIFYDIALGEGAFKNDSLGYAVVYTLATAEEKREASLRAFLPRQPISHLENVGSDIIIIAESVEEASELFVGYLFDRHKLLPVSDTFPAVYELISKQGKGVYPYKNP